MNEANKIHMNEIKMGESPNQSKAIINSARFSVVCVLMLSVYASPAHTKPTAAAGEGIIFAQTLVEGTVAKHSELLGLELAMIPPHGHDCITIAATDLKEMGEKCDKDDLGIMKTGTPTVEKEGDGYDVTLPLRVGGKIIGSIGLDFKLDQQESGLIDRAKIIAKELEDQIPEKSKLFEAAK
jgi:hypothetical protein